MTRIEKCLPGLGSRRRTGGSIELEQQTQQTGIGGELDLSGRWMTYSFFILTFTLVD